MERIFPQAAVAECSDFGLSITSPIVHVGICFQTFLSFDFACSQSISSLTGHFREYTIFLHVYLNLLLAKLEVLKKKIRGQFGRCTIVAVTKSGAPYYSQKNMGMPSVISGFSVKPLL